MSVPGPMLQSEKPIGTREEPIMFFESNGSGPYFHACGGGKAMRDWLSRQIATGQVNADDRAVVERMIADLDEKVVAAAGYNGLIPPDEFGRYSNLPTKADL